MDILLVLAILRKRTAAALDAVAFWRRIERYQREGAERDRLAAQDRIIAAGREWSRTRDLDAAIEKQAKVYSDSRLSTLKEQALLDDLMRLRAKEERA